MQGPLVAALTAVAMCAVNTTLGLVIAKKAFQGELQTFIAVVFGSLAARSMAVLVGVWYFIAIAEMHMVSFALTFAIVGFVFLMGEILFFHHSLEESKRQVRPPVTDLLKKKLNDVLIELFASPVFSI